MTGAEGNNYITIRIDETKCTRCYDCVDLCPTSALTLDKGIFVHNAYECAYDEVCMNVCPEQCLEILEM